MLSTVVHRRSGLHVKILQIKIPIQGCSINLNSNKSVGLIVALAAGCFFSAVTSGINPLAPEFPFKF